MTSTKEYRTATSVEFSNNFDKSTDIVLDLNEIYKKEFFDLGAEIYRGMKLICQSNNIELRDVIISGLLCLIYKFTGDGNILIGIKGHESNGLKGRGYGVLPFDIVFNEQTTLENLIRHITYKKVGILRKRPCVLKGDHENSKNKLVNKESIFNIICIFDDVKKELREQFHESAFIFDIGNEGVSCCIQYDSNRCDIDRILCIKKYFIRYLLTLKNNYTEKIANIELMTKKDRRVFLKEFNDTATDYSKNRTISEIFEQQTKRDPNRIAIKYKNSTLTYRDLNKQANQVARYLMEAEVTKGDIVAIIMLNSSILIASIIGALKIGAVCFPIDGQYPIERIDYMLKDSNARVVIIDNPIHKKHFDYLVTLTINTENLRLYDSDNLGIKCRPTSLAYIIYTSGSTGRPKGVMLNHRGIINHIETKIIELELDATDTVPLSLSVAFVASIWLVFSPLFIGAKLVLYPESILSDCYQLFNRIKEDEITLFEIVPSLLKAYLEVLRIRDISLDLPHLKKLILTGEKVDRYIVNKFYSMYDIQLINAYGQTECSDDTLHYYIPKEISESPVKIGRPSHNTRIYILDKCRKMQPIGVPGDLCISGDGLAMGYLNLPDLTSEKFVCNPYEPGELMYITGDIAKWNDDGTVSFIGRVDQQVKVRGHRIELGEIEKFISNYPGITDSVIVNERSSGDSVICGYIVSGEKVKLNELRQYLQNKLPDYMIPSYFFQLEKIPLNANNKIDRKALSEYRKNFDIKEAYQVPMNKKEIKLINILKRILDIRNIGMEDDYSYLGIDSLKASILVSQIASCFGVEISLADVLQCNTPRDLLACIKRGQSHSFCEIRKVGKRDFYNIAPMQEMFYELWCISKEERSYNMPILMTPNFKIEKEKLGEALYKLAQRHSVLRATFVPRGNKIKQVIHEDPQVKIKHIKVTDRGYNKFCVFVKIS